MDNLISFKRKTTEMEEFLLSGFVIGLSFSIAFAQFSSSLYSPRFADFYLPAGMFSGFSAFALHELAHRQVAIRYGYKPRFRMWLPGLFISLASSFLGFIFAAPGATEVYNVNNRKLYGLISISGPLTNIFLGMFLFIFGSFNLGWISQVFLIAGSVNIAIAFFNLLPIPPLDGYNVLKWDTSFYALMFVISIVLLIVIDKGFF